MKRNSLLRILSLVLSFLLPLLSQAQAPEMADEMRSNGKIYIVLACVLLVLGGMLAFLLILESRLSKLEKEEKK
jgi:hypothetical protein